MLTQVAEGVFVHQSEFMQTNAVVVHGRAGALLVDPGVRADELACLADDLAQAGRVVVAGFATHPHWDHLLWIDAFGAAPRYGTAVCAATVRERMSDPGFKARLAGLIPSDIADQVPLDRLGLITGLPDGATQLEWDGPRVRIVQHRAHAPGHAALVIEESDVLVAGDMLSDLLVPMLDVSGGAADPRADYLTALQLIEDAAGGVDVVIPGHGSVGGAADLRARIDQDRRYVETLRDGRSPDDPRIDPARPR